MRASVENKTVANFKFHENTLTVNVELYWENHAEFLKCCKCLIESEYDRIVLDLTQVTFIFSTYMGTIGRLLAQCTKENKHLTVRIPSSLSWLFEAVGFDKIVDIEVMS